MDGDDEEDGDDSDDDDDDDDDDDGDGHYRQLWSILRCSDKCSPCCPPQAQDESKQSTSKRDSCHKPLPLRTYLKDARKASPRPLDA